MTYGKVWLILSGILGALFVVQTIRIDQLQDEFAAELQQVKAGSESYISDRVLDEKQPTVRSCENNPRARQVRLGR